MESPAVNGSEMVNLSNIHSSADRRSEGAGHYVKMVHNGIEYGDMQLIAEVGLQPKESRSFF
jgi:6-phosphogluconate dehydrogenase (decarboxylating)